MKPSQPAVGDMMRRMKKDHPELHYVEHRVKPHPGFATAQRQIVSKLTQRTKQGQFTKTVALVALLCFLPTLAFGAAGTVPAGASGGTLSQWSVLPTNDMASIYFVISNDLPVFPNVSRQLLNSRPLRFGWLGDSIGNLTMEEVSASLASYHGRNGAALYGANYLGPTLGPSATTNVTRITNWFAAYHDMGTGGFVTYSNFFGFPYTWSDRLGCEWLFQTNGGSFRFQVATNGGTFSTVLTIDTSTASTNLGGVTNYAILPGYYAIRVTNDSAGLVSVIGVDAWATNAPGVRVSYLNAAATTMQDMAGVPSSVSEPILRHLNLDLLTLEGTTDPTVNVEAAVSNLNYRSFRTLTNTDLVFLGTTPVADVHAFDYVTFNAAYRAVAGRAGRFFLDQSIISGTFSNMQVMGWSGDGLHRSNNLSRLCASALMQQAKLFDSTMDNEGRLMSRSNMFTGPLTVSNSLMIAGNASQLKIYDRNAAVPPSPGYEPFHGIIDALSGGIMRFGFKTAGGAFEGYGLRFHSGYGTRPLPMAVGDELGHKDFPWRMNSTNGVDWGIGGFTNNFEVGLWTIAGAGNGNTNYLLLASKGAQWAGSSNIHVYAISDISSTAMRSFTVRFTNMSANTWGWSASNGTNRWRYRNLHTGGTNAPSVFTNNTILTMRCDTWSTNVLAEWHMQATP